MFTFLIPVVMTEALSGLSGRVQGRNRPALTNCERGLKECEIINQPNESCGVACGGVAIVF